MMTERVQHHERNRPRWIGSAGVLIHRLFSVLFGVSVGVLVGVLVNGWFGVSFGVSFGMSIRGGLIGVSLTACYLVLLYSPRKH